MHTHQRTTYESSSCIVPIYVGDTKMTTHQKLSEYTGGLYISPKPPASTYGIEGSDFVVGTGGGLSSIHHHPTQGFYGAGNMSYDIYAGQPPHNLQGIDGNAYAKGETSTQTRGYYSTEGYEKIEIDDDIATDTPTSSLTTNFGLSVVILSIGLFLVSYSFKDGIQTFLPKDSPLVLLVCGVMLMSLGYLGEQMK